MATKTRTQPKPPFPPQPIEPPGDEHKMNPRPRYQAPLYRGAEKLKDLVAIITGGDSGIGRSVATLFAREGADVAIAYLPDEQTDAEETQRAVEQEGRHAILVPGDVRDVKYCRDLVEQTVKHFGKLDILVNNAAFQKHRETIDEVDEEQWDRTFKTNIYGYFYMVKAAMPHLKRGATIINTGSITGLEGSPGLLDYSATKGAIHAFTKSLAQNLIEKGIRVNCVAPGPVWTPLNPAERSDAETKKFGAETPMGRPAQPEEIAPAFVFFASAADSSYITGEVLTLLGGDTTAAEEPLMKITLLVYVESESAEEYDKSIDQIAAALKHLGHTPSIYCVHADIPKLITGLRRRKPDLIFNLLEQFGGRMLGLVEITGLIDLLDFPYTGSGAGELFLQEDKALAKKILAYDDVKSPDYAMISPAADLETGGNLRMPLFVKPLRTDSSFGIDAKRSLVHNTAELMEQVVRIHKKFNDAALCEEFIPGREFYVAILGNQRPQAFPPIEMDFSGMPEGAPHVMDANAKFAEGTAEYKGTQPIVAELDDELRARLQQVALDSYRALRIRDYGRVDLRLSETGEIYVIEVNANCYLERESEYAMAARAAGVEYEDLIGKIVELALERHKLR